MVHRILGGSDRAGHSGSLIRHSTSAVPPITTFPRPVSVHMEGILRVSVWFVWRVSVYTVNGCVSEVTWEYCCLIAAPVCGKFRM